MKTWCHFITLLVTENDQLLSHQQKLQTSLTIICRKFKGNAGECMITCCNILILRIKRSGIKSLNILYINTVLKHNTMSGRHIDHNERSSRTHTATTVQGNTRQDKSYFIILHMLCPLYKQTKFHLYSHCSSPSQPEV